MIKDLHFHELGAFYETEKFPIFYPEEKNNLLDIKV